MNITLDMPLITGGSPESQIHQIKSYLYQMAQQLQYALSQTESREAVMTQVQGALDKVAVQNDKSPLQRFNDIKALIIKSADIVESYYEKIDSLIATSGKYVATSDFGTYGDFVAQSLKADADSIQQNIGRIEVIAANLTQTDDKIGNVEKNAADAISGLEGSIGSLSDTLAGSVNFLKKQQSYIRYGTVGTTLDDSGIASETAPGIEIGDYQAISDGYAQTDNQRFARFTSYGLELFGEEKDKPPVAYIKQSKLFITNAEITDSVKLGGFLIQRSNGLSIDWVGG